ncbi:MAG: phage holin family protein [Dehalococcoidia bacterium]
MGWVVYERRMGYPDRRSLLLAVALRFAINFAAIFLAAEIVPGVSLGNLESGLVAAAILGAVNAVVKPLLTCLTIALTIITLGLFLLVINAAMLALTAWLTGLLSFEFEVEDFWAALFGGAIVALVSLLANLYTAGTRDRLRMGGFRPNG